MPNREENLRSFVEQRNEAQRLEAIALAKQAEAAAAAEASSKAEHYRDLKNKAQPKWEEVSKMAKEFYHNRQMGYDSLQSAMSAQFAFCLVTAEALQAQAPIIIGGIVDSLGGAVDFIGGIIPKAAPQELELQYTLDFNADKYVSCKLKRSDGKPITQELADIFSALVVNFFEGQGYELSAENGSLSQYNRRAGGQALDSGAFEGMKPDFQAYLEDIVRPNQRSTPGM